MFTTLTVIKGKRKTFAERLHFIRKRRYISEYNEYRNCGFYTTRLISYAGDNTQSIEKFASRADMPIISENSAEVFRFRYITIANTVFREKKGIDILGIYDISAALPFLLPHISAYCGCIFIFTKCKEKYTEKCDEIYRTFGTPIILSDGINALKNARAVFTTEALPTAFHCPVYGVGGRVPISLNLPDNLKSAIPDYCDPYLVAAGLYFIEGFKELGRLSCNI